MSQAWKTIHNRWWAASFYSFLLPLSWKSFLLIIIKDKDGAGSRSGYASQPVDQPGGKHKGKHQVVHPVLRHQMLTEQWSYLFSLCSEIHTVNSVQLFGFPKKKKTNTWFRITSWWPSDSVCSERCARPQTSPTISLFLTEGNCSAVVLIDRSFTCWTNNPQLKFVDMIKNKVILLHS